MGSINFERMFPLNLRTLFFKNRPLIDPIRQTFDRREPRKPYIFIHHEAAGPPLGHWGVVRRSGRVALPVPVAVAIPVAVVDGAAF